MVEELIKKAAILHEALPYIRRFRGTTFVIKYGGHAMTEEALRESFARDVLLLRYVGVRPVVVHGGGPQIDATLERLGIRSTRVEGLRITDEDTMDVVSMVLRGRVNREIVAMLQRYGARAVGLSGIDDSLLLAHKAPPVRLKDGREVDTGRVGTVRDVRPQVLSALLDASIIPVVAPIAADAEGAPLNINADTAAGEIAAAMRAEKLILMTDTEGVLDGDGALIKSLTPQSVAGYRDAEVIKGGMIPKVECALRALAGGVNKCHVIDGRRQHAILLEIFTDSGVGTELVRS
ncbi:MAG: acetylglutamate kinase [Myxococcales bacterium]|nr:acetylglutamate kinase [Myxococcales bacterium]